MCIIECHTISRIVRREEGQKSGTPVPLSLCVSGSTFSVNGAEVRGRLGIVPITYHWTGLMVTPDLMT